MKVEIKKEINTIQLNIHKPQQTTLDNKKFNIIRMKVNFAQLWLFL